MGIEKAKIRFAIQNVFYNDTLGAWFDYDTEKKAHNPNFYPSVVMPLFATCYQEMDLAKPQRVYDYMEVKFSDIPLAAVFFLFTAIESLKFFKLLHAFAEGWSI